MSKVGRSIADDVIMAGIAILSVGLVALEETVRAVRPESLHLVYLLDGIIVVIMSGDWLYHFNRAPDKRAYLRRTAWELPGLLPLIILPYNWLRMTRLLRLLRAYRAYRQAQSEVQEITASTMATRISGLAWVAGGATLLGSVLVWSVERTEPASSLQHYPDALWWAVVTVTTVGYGDVVPITAAGRIIAVFLIVVGIAALALLVSILSTTLVREEAEEIEEEAIASAAPYSVAGQLSQLAALHDEGKLTDEEYAVAKTRVLSR